MICAQLEKQMKEAAKAMEFERAAQLRDEIADLRRFVPSHAMGGDKPKRKPQKTYRAR